MADLALYEEYLDLPIDAPANLHGFALDIGASLTKLVYVEDAPEKQHSSDGRNNSVRLRLMTFTNDKLKVVLEIIKQKVLPEDRGSSPMVVIGYGHGVQRARDLINTTLGLTIDYTDEFTSFGVGFHHLFKHIPLEELLHPEEGAIPKDHIAEEDRYPLVLNFLGSAIIYLSIVESPDGKPKISIAGTLSRGGLYFLCMSKMLLGTQNFKEIMSLVERGDPTNVNLTIKDRNGTEITEHPFGKIWNEGIESPKREDVAAALFENTCDDIRLVASTALNGAKAKSIYFVGSFAKDNKKFREIMKTLPELEVQHGRAPVKVGFPRYEGYIGAIGAFIIGVEKLSDPDAKLMRLNIDRSQIGRVMAEAGLSPQEMAQMAQMMGGGGPPDGGHPPGSTGSSQPEEVSHVSHS
ncbi:uncharacterized protein LOC135494560 isoform X1 [Lineus longissimus]|uniref:uncharacterized protein LOC135494560 isoform X1 n=1 Tax=Lineus longissimus TaxID=88925 RepID=UPI002B4E9B90